MDDGSWSQSFKFAPQMPNLSQTSLALKHPRGTTKGELPIHLLFEAGKAKLIVKVQSTSRLSLVALETFVVV